MYLGLGNKYININRLKLFVGDEAQTVIINSRLYALSIDFRCSPIYVPPIVR